MSFPKRAIPLTWLAGIFLLNFLLRLPDIGHFLTWDEAWLLSSLKNILQEHQLYSVQLRKHPPIYIGLGLLLAPAKPGFDIRMQILSLVISSGALVFFTILFAKLYGRKIALLAGLIYTMLPSTLFFDTWIKRDGLVTLFCALTLISLLEKKDILAGVFCGLCFLAKETAVFFIPGFLAVILIRKSSISYKRSLLLFTGAAIAVSSWWYISFYSFTGSHLAFFKGSSEEASGFLQLFPADS